MKNIYLHHRLHNVKWSFNVMHVRRLSVHRRHVDVSFDKFLNNVNQLNRLLFVLHKLNKKSLRDNLKLSNNWFLFSLNDKWVLTQNQYRPSSPLDYIFS